MNRHSSSKDLVRHEQASSSRVSQLLAAVMVGTALVLCTAVGSRLVEVPPTLPQSFWEWLELIFGAILILGTALIVPFFVKVVRTLANVMSRRPRNEEELALLRTLRRARGAFWRPGRITVSAATLVLITVFVVPNIHSAGAGSDLEPGTITIMSGSDESPSYLRRILIDQWNRSHPNNQAKIRDDQATGEPDSQHRNMVDDAKPGGEHQADLYVLDIVWMEEFIKNGYIRPLDQSRRATSDTDFIANVLETCRELDGDHNVLWALPLNTDVGMIYYRSDLGVKPPESWSDYYGGPAKTTLADIRSNPLLRDLAAKLKAANAAQLANEEILTVTALEAILAHGGALVNKDGRLILNQGRFDSNTVRALQELAAVSKDPDIAPADPEAPPPAGEGMSDNEATQYFKSGAAMFMRNWPVVYDTLRTNDNQPPVPFKVAKLPHTSVLGGQNLAISASSKRPRAAQALIEFLTSDSSQLILATVGGFAPTRADAYPSDSVNSRPYNAFLLDTIRAAQPRPRIRAYTDFSIEFRRGIKFALNNNGVIEEDLPRKLAEIAQR
jgi:multiple sugar transport system substrate-binding protein